MKQAAGADLRGKRSGESGFAMLLVFALAAAVAISLYMELPRVAFEAQRNKEQLLIERGEQYQRAIQVFYRKNKRYPGTLEQLENLNNVRYLRRRYKDPMTGKDEWRLIHIQNGVLTDSLTQAPPGLKKDEKEGTGGTADQQAAGTAGAPGTAQGATLATRRRPSDQPAYASGGPPAWGQVEGSMSPGGTYQPPQPNQPYPYQPPAQPGQAYPYQAGQPYPTQPPQPGQPAPAYPQVQPGQTPPYGYPQPQPNQAAVPGQPYPVSPQTPQVGQPYPVSPQASQVGQPYPVSPQTPQPGQPYPAYPQPQPGQAYPQTQPGQVQPYPLPPGQQPYPAYPNPQPAQAQPYPQAQQTAPAPVYPYPQAQPGQAPVYRAQPGSQTSMGQNPSPFYSPQYPQPAYPQPAAPSAGFGPAQTPPTGFGTAGSRAPLAGSAQNPATDLINHILTTPRPGGLGTMSGVQTIGGGIAGVASTSEAEGIKIYGEKTKYNEWEFIYDLRKDRTMAGPMGLGGMPGTIPGQQPGQFQQPGQLQQPGQPPPTLQQPMAPIPPPGPTPGFGRGR